MKNYLIITLTFFSLVISYRCNKEKTDDFRVIRPLVEFTTADIPTFDSMTQTKKMDNSFFGVTQILNDTYTAKFEFKWVSDNGDFAYFDIWIFNNYDDAAVGLLEMHKYYTNPFINESIDEPATVGDISYMKGREFIRDNLIVRIYTSDKFDGQVTEIAKYIDSKILESQSFISISQVKPIIEDFKIENNPVIENSQTPLIINTSDPNDKEIAYQWRFSRNSRYGGVLKDDSENYYYTSDWLDSENDTIGLTLIALNEYGFCTDSTINIQIVKE